MNGLARHRMGALLLDALRQQQLGARDLFEGRQEPLSWFFRTLAYDQSELDILESGAVETLHAPSALVELMIDEMALGLHNIGPEGLATYLVNPPVPGEQQGEPLDPAAFELDIGVMLGFLNVDIAPPGLWLDERESEGTADHNLASGLTGLAEEIGAEAGADVTEVNIEGSLGPAGEWPGDSEAVRPAGVSVHFTFDIPLVGTDERRLVRIFERGARCAAETLERLRSVFRA